MRYDYELQVWVNARNQVVQCSHPTSMGNRCCNGNFYATWDITEALKHYRQNSPRGL